MGARFIMVIYSNVLNLLKGNKYHKHHKIQKQSIFMNYTYNY